VRRLKNCTGYSCISNLQVLAYKASFVTMYWCFSTSGFWQKLKH
jgi:hypothetical protein